MDFGARMNASKFWVKRSRVKVTVGSNMPQNSLFGLVVLHFGGGIIVNRSRNHRLVIFQLGADI